MIENESKSDQKEPVTTQVAPSNPLAESQQIPEASTEASEAKQANQPRGPGGRELKEKKKQVPPEVKVSLKDLLVLANVVKACDGDVKKAAATVQANLPETNRWSKEELEGLLTRAYQDLASQITSPLIPPITTQKTNLNITTQQTILSLPGGVTVANMFTCRACNVSCTTQKEVHDHCYSPTHCINATKMVASGAAMMRDGERHILNASIPSSFDRTPRCFTRPRAETHIDNFFCNTNARSLVQGDIEYETKFIFGEKRTPSDHIPIIISLVKI